MNQVTEDLYVGDIKDADSTARLEDKNIDTILNVSYQTTNPDFRRNQDTYYAHHPLQDGEQDDHQIRLAINTAQEMREHTENSMLVHCDVGSNRSVVIAAALMSLENGEPVRSNIDSIKTIRSAANPVKELADQTSRVTRKLYN